MRMSKALWLLTRTIALSVIVDVGVAAGQTVIVRGAPPGAPVEVLMDGGNARSATADANGNAAIEVALPAGNSQAAVQVFVERCDPTVRVQLVRRGVPIPPAGAGCQRGEVSGAFLMQAITTFVVESAVGGGTVYVRQGPPPRSWLDAGEEGAGPGPFRGGTPMGLTLWGGAGLSHDADAAKTGCGDVTSCSGGAVSVAVGAGGTYWLTRNVGVQAAIARRAKATAEGSGTGFEFSSAADTQLFALTGLVGGSVGSIRIYGQGGLDRRRTTIRSTQTVEDRVVTVNNATQTLPGGTQTVEYTTEGWGWTAGGGLEAWANRFLGIYVDAQLAKLRGSDVTGGEARINDTLLLVTAGIRVHIGR